MNDYRNRLIRNWEPTGSGCYCHKPGATSCIETALDLAAKNRELDYDDIADSISKVLLVFGQLPWMVRRARPAIRRSLIHYEEVRYRIDRVPKKRFCKEDLMKDLTEEAGMTRIQCQLVYSVTKRAFRAYYHGTVLHGKRYMSMENLLTHNPGCLWLHAARRTAEVFAAYMGLMYSEQRQYEERIECIYKVLYDILESRLTFNDHVCNCNNPKKENQSNNTPMIDTSEKHSQTEILFFRTSLLVSNDSSRIGLHVEKTSVHLSLQSRTLIRKSSESTFSKKSTTSVYSKKERKVCHCPKMECRCDMEIKPPIISAECSQGPYICRWLPYDDSEEFKEHRVPCPPMEVICRPCLSEATCDSDCTCTCQFCQCERAYSGDGETEHGGEKLSAAGIEDHDTDYCYLAPFRDGPRKERQLLIDEKDGEEELEEEDTLFQCPCTCDIKQRAYPHLFTYLAPFRDPSTPVPFSSKSEKPVDKSIPVYSDESQVEKKPPCGVAKDVYKCWTKKPVKSEPPKQRDFQQEELLLGGLEMMVLSKLQKPPDEKTIKMDVKVKTQLQAGSNRPSLTNRNTTSTTPSGSAASRPSAQKGKSPSQSQPTKQSTTSTPAPAKPNTIAPASNNRQQPSMSGANAPAQNEQRASNSRDPPLTKNDVMDILGL